VSDGLPGDTSAPALPTGLGTHPTPSHRDNQRRPVLPIIPRLPGSPTTPQPTSATSSPQATTPAATAAAAPGQTSPAATPATPAPSTAAPAGQGEHAAATPPAPAGQATHSDDDDQPDQPHQDAAAAAKPAIDPKDLAGLLSGLAEPLAGLPAALMGIGPGLLAPFNQILSQFGQGTPATPSSGGFPQDVLDRLGNADASTGITGDAGAAYQSDVDTQANQARAMDNLERKLRTSLHDSAANSTLGREKIEQIINQVKSALQAMGTIANTPMGQLGVLTTIAQGLQQAGAVLTEAVGKDSLNAGTVKAMSTDYLKDLNAGGPNSEEQQHLLTAGGPKAWAIKALAANGITDPRAVANWLPGLLTIGQRESGNNPRAVNGGDSNALRGTPSKGWMQTIGPTFAAHWRPGTSRDIFDPVANAAAAIHYVMTRYNVSPDGSDLMRKVQQANPYASPKGY
jgi:hypothetical protein